jgi:hypothetical protein
VFIYHLPTQLTACLRHLARHFKTDATETVAFCFGIPENTVSTGLASVAGPVIQATGRSVFEDGLGSGDFVPGYSYHMSVRTGLPDHTMQTKFQSQRPSDVETPVPSI